MSKVVDAIMAKRQDGVRIGPVGKFSPLFNDVFSEREDFSPIAPPTLQARYKITVTLGHTTWIPEGINQGAIIEDAVERTKKAVIEAIFGEFRPWFRRIEKEIYEGSFEEAGKLLGQMEDEMFRTSGGNK